MQKRQDYPIWHPFTQMQTEGFPILIERAQKEFLYDDQGRKIIDAVSSWWTNIHGHAHPALRQAINEQAEKLEQVIFAGFTHEPAIELSQKLLALTENNFAKVFFSDDGSTAVEVGIKMVMQYHYYKSLDSKRARPMKILALENAYHGDTFGAMSAAGANTFTLAFADYFFEVIHVPAPYFSSDYSKEKAALQTFQDMLEKYDCALFVYEPLVQGAGGMLMHNTKALAQMIRMAKNKNVLCLADEVMTGFGRTGTMFASQQLNEWPHVMALSKGLSGGFLPLSVTLATQEIYNAFLSQERSRAFFHGHSFTANPLSCAVANASLELFQTEDTMQKITKISQQHQEFQISLTDKALARKWPLKNVRRCGTILAFDVEENSSDYLSPVRDFFYNFFLDNGVLLRPLGNTIYIMPPYCISEKSLKRIYSLIIDALNAFWQ